MLGLGDIGVFMVYILCILSVIACIIYGVINWNKGSNTEKDLEIDSQLEQKGS